MVDGADQAAAELALERGWDLVSPLPFGKCLNVAINATPTNAADARALLAGNSASDSQTQARAERIMALTTQARVFDLADQDEKIGGLFLATLDAQIGRTTCRARGWKNVWCSVSAVTLKNK